MIPLSEILTRMKKELNIPDMEDDEPYILTEDEEKEIVAGNIKNLKEHTAWKMVRLGFSEEYILQKFTQVDWEAEIDKEQLFKQMNGIKHHKLWQKEQRQKEMEVAILQQQQLREKCTARYMFKLMAWTSKNVFERKLIVHDDNRHLITTMCFFLSRDERFVSELGYDTRKGLWIRGVTGLGKTYFAQCLENNELNPILILSLLEITEAINREGRYDLVMGEKKILYLDDVGSEDPVVVFYKNYIEWFKNFIELRALNSNDHSRLIVSTNSDFDKIEKNYGSRVRSRINTMFNIIDVTGPDMRRTIKTINATS